MRCGEVVRVWLFLIAILAFTATPAIAQTNSTPVKIVTAALDRAHVNLGYLDTELSFNRLIDPTVDATAVQSTINKMVAAARQIAGPKASVGVKLDAVRKVIYDAGPWNDNRPFAYDLTDPLGQEPGNRRLSTYLKTRLGNCVSMPTLYLIIADRLGLNVHLVTAPLHVFVRYTLPSGEAFNIEATSGGHFSRDEWYRTNFHMSDRAIQSGIYMRTLSRHEDMAQMATTVSDALLEAGRYQEAIDVDDAILAVNPRDAYTMVKRGTAYSELLRVEFVDKYPTPAQIPAALRPRYQMLAETNAKAFRDAEALGWEPES